MPRDPQPSTYENVRDLTPAEKKKIRDMLLEEDRLDKWYKKKQKEEREKPLKEYRERKTQRKHQRDIRYEPLQEQYEGIQEKKKYNKYQREQRSFEQDEKIRDIKAETKYLLERRGTGKLKKTLKRERFRAEHPVLERVQRTGERSYRGLTKASEQAQRGIQRQGTRTFRRIASRFIGGSERTPHTGLSTVIDEISYGYVDHFQRSYFDEPNQADRNFFNSIETIPMAQRDILGQSNRDMNLLVDTPESIQKKKEQRYY